MYITLFTTLRHRTREQHAKKKKKLKKGVKVHLDLTKRRHNILQDANSSVKDNGEVKFCYAHVTCRLKTKQNDDLLEDHFFSSMNGLEDLFGGGPGTPVTSEMEFFMILVNG